ncbi:MAG: polysaccharide biosynthesis C-terminal domain-containing protein [Agathobacter sp.]|nr:polysaccharide biosynthesis C-terminal domain-containing protein [Agathobacter sp.]
METVQKSKRNIFYGLLGQVATIVLGILIPRLVIVNYGSEINGLLNSVGQIFVYFGLFEAGIGMASTQALFKPVVDNDTDSINGILSATSLFYYKTGTLYLGAVILLALGYPFLIWGSTSIPYWKIAAIIFFGGAGNCLAFFYQNKYTVLMSAQGYYYIYTNITTIITVLTSLTKVILLLLGFDVIAVQLSYFIICFLQMGIYYIYLRKNYSWIDWKAKPNKKAISQKNATLVHQVASLVFYNTDTLILTIFTKDLKIVSVYTIYNMVTTMVTQLVGQVSSGINFRMGQLYNSEKEAYIRMHHICEIVYTTLAFASMTTTYYLLPSFVKLYTAGVTDAVYYSPSYPLLFILIPLFTIGRTSLNCVITYAGHFKQTQWSAIIESGINLIVSIVGVIYFGIYGVLVGSIVSVIYRAIYMLIYSYKNLLHDNPFHTIKRWIMHGALMLICFLLIPQSTFQMQSYISLAVVGMLAAVVSLIYYGIGQALINREEMKNIMGMMKGFIRR